MSRKSKSKDQTKALNIPLTLTQGDLLQEALAITFAKDQTQSLNIPVKVLTEWNGSKRVDLRFWETDTIPTKVGVSLSLPQWKVLYSAMQVVDDSALPPSSSSTTTIALKFHPKHAINKHKTKHIMKISHISFI
jgi:hypothetical protein